MILLLSCLFLQTAEGSDAAAAADASTDATAQASHSQAEYYRLRQEMEKLASRNAWSGVEKMYRQLQGTGQTLSFEDNLLGAHAARALGDVTSARERLLLCNEMREDREVLDWLWDVDSHYGVVWLAADPGTLTLAADQMPFNPDQAKAVEFAQRQIAETGMFEGYLPAGLYRFGDHEVKVQPRVQAFRIDVRTDEGMRAQEQKARKEKKKGKD